jgi:hypothetical protein
MNKAFTKSNIIYIIIKSSVLAALITLFEGWRQNDLIFNLSSIDLTGFTLIFSVSFVVLLIIEVIKDSVS